MSMSGKEEAKDFKSFTHHKTEVCQLVVNFDGTRLASGDKSGDYCIWDTLNGQCLKSATMKGIPLSLGFFHCMKFPGKILSLMFTEHWPSLSEKQAPALIASVAVLKKQIEQSMVLTIFPKSTASIGCDSKETVGPINKAPIRIRSFSSPRLKTIWTDSSTKC